MSQLSTERKLDGILSSRLRAHACGFGDAVSVVCPKHGADGLEKGSAACRAGASPTARPQAPLR